MFLPHDNQLAADIASDSDSEAEDTQRGDGADGADGASSDSDGSGVDGEEDYHSENDPNLDSGDDELETKAKGRGGASKALQLASKTQEDEDEVCDGNCYTGCRYTKYYL